MSRERHFLVVPSIWEQPWSEDARTVAFYLLTCRHRVTEGLYKLSLAGAAEDIGWDTERFREGFVELLEDGFVEHDPETRMVLLTGALEIQSPANPNVDKAAIKALASFPSSPLFGRLHELAERSCKRFAKALVEAYPERIAKSLSPTQPPSPSPIPSPPQTPPPSAGGQRQRQHHPSPPQAGEPPKNSRIHGTNPRATGKLELVRLSVEGIAAPSAEQVEAFKPILVEARKAVTDTTWHLWLERLQLAGIEEGAFVVSLPERQRAYVVDRFSRLITACGEAHGISVRFATATENAGLVQRDKAA